MLQGWKFDKEKNMYLKTFGRYQLIVEPTAEGRWKGTILGTGTHYRGATFDTPQEAEARIEKVVQETLRG